MHLIQLICTLKNGLILRDRDDSTTMFFLIKKQKQKHPSIDLELDYLPLNLALPLPSYVTLGKLPNSSVSYFLSYRGDSIVINILISSTCCGD